MHATATATVHYLKPPAAAPTLDHTIGRIRSEFQSMKKELRDLQRENRRLKREMTCWRAILGKVKVDNIAALRRQVAFFCHPDRGGDGELMSKLNTLFDFMSLFEKPASEPNTQC